MKLSLNFLFKAVGIYKVVHRLFPQGIYRKTKIIEKFLEELLYYSQDKRIITDDSNTLGFPNYPEFIDNRHDQTVLSLLTKKYGFANSGKPNMNISELNQSKDNFPYIFCHYRRMPFNDYDDLLEKCHMKKYRLRLKYIF